MLRFVDVTAPVYDEGRFIGVLAAHLSWDWVDEVRRAVPLDDFRFRYVRTSGHLTRQQNPLGPCSRVGVGLQAQSAGLRDGDVTDGWIGTVQRTWLVSRRSPALCGGFHARDDAHLGNLANRYFLGRFRGLRGRQGRDGHRASHFPTLADQAAAVRDGADVSCIETSSRFIEVKALSDVLASAFRARDQKEEELLTVNTLLEERVLFRTRQLEEARRRAEHATEAKSNFLATVSHEIRSPLNSIIGFADLLLDEPSLAPDVARRIGLITVPLGSHNGHKRHLGRSKIEAGKVELNEDVFAPSCLLTTTLELVEVQAASKQIGLELALAGDMPAFVRGDMAPCAR